MPIEGASKCRHLQCARSGVILNLMSDLQGDVSSVDRTSGIFCLVNRVMEEEWRSNTPGLSMYESNF